MGCADWDEGAVVFLCYVQPADAAAPGYNSEYEVGAAAGVGCLRRETARQRWRKGRKHCTPRVSHVFACKDALI